MLMAHNQAAGGDGSASHSLCYHACTHWGLPIACAPPACWQVPWLASLQKHVAIRNHHVMHERIGAA